MARRHTDELADWVKKRKRKGREKNLIAFHGVRDDVKAAIDAGYSAKTIRSNMPNSGRVGFGYETLLNYVNRLVKKPGDAKPGIQSGVELAPPPLPAAPTSATPARRAGMPTFKFNPVPTNKEETQ